MVKNKIISPLRLPNGKKRYATKIVSKFPKNTKEIRDINCTAGNISIASRYMFPEAKIWMNSVDSDIINFFKYASYYNFDVKKYIFKWMSEYKHKDLFDFCKEVIIKEKSKIIDTHYVKIAAAYFIINRLSYSGTMNGGYTEYNYENRLTLSSIDRLTSLDNFIQHNWMLTSMYWETLIESPSSFKDKDVLIYANTPYFHPSMQMYHKSESCGNLFDYEKLANMLAQTQYNFMVTVDDSNYMRSLFGFANCVSESTLRGDNHEKSNKVIEKELLYITNF